MSRLPLGWATDLAVARLKGAEVAEFSDHLLVRTPDNPEYHWGNFVLVTDASAVDDTERWLGVFETAFPRARHRSVGLPAAADPARWAAVGLDLETEDVLASDRVPQSRPLDSAYDVRPLGTPEDWAAQIENDARENTRTGEYDTDLHRRFLVGRSRARQGVVAAGQGTWFGAFAGDRLVADLGIVLCGDGVARYQDVGTDVAHRRRGLAGHLLGVAARWAQQRGARRWVIITEADNPAGRVYRSVGFAPVESGVQAYRPPTRVSESEPPGSASSESRDNEAL
ncbi:N-acetyltransferase [Marmoricola endophyticus]|uniref:N-acetyltransferase n=1 Tax=Marmoricola endophyticus TaxID=2040280 RepID=A0A917BFP9_9ACTN|nr:GNAT family N-acetyltransferase [Marmoricola endophyticus]GGF41763.1 N-acetyltransferase [Marmoricola endophyticus]